MIKGFYKILFLGLIGLISSCDSTGICTEDITPSLMIGFTDFNNLNNEVAISPPTGIQIFGNRDGENINAKDLYQGSDKNDTTFYSLYPSIVTVNEDKLIPLIFDVNRDDLTYILAFLDSETETYSLDTIKMSYVRDQVFVSSECGYKTIFREVELDSYSENNIENVELLVDEIEYDIDQHIKILIKS